MPTTKAPRTAAENFAIQAILDLLNIGAEQCMKREVKLLNEVMGSAEFSAEFKTEFADVWRDQVSKLPEISDMLMLQKIQEAAELHDRMEAERKTMLDALRDVSPLNYELLWKSWYSPTTLE